MVARQTTATRTTANIPVISTRDVTSTTRTQTTGSGSAGQQKFESFVGFTNRKCCAIRVSVLQWSRNHRHCVENIISMVDESKGIQPDMLKFQHVNANGAPSGHRLLCEFGNVRHFNH